MGVIPLLTKHFLDIPLGRLELAAYLCADHSTLTRELSQMRSEGLLALKESSFKIIQ
ncbi:helix-turn-helix domain-containing protein [Anaerotignum sp. MB30-C6]|uniref:helix-turn-helix domain-containing protein n=1 Tax=Anaerotignum sp. MB30-C6 TaxID=3070814 RepID=UPI003FA43EC1